MSDIDLIAVTCDPLNAEQCRSIVQWHRDLDAGEARGANLGCVYVAAGALHNSSARWPTWTHGQLIERPLSLMTCAELRAFGKAVKGRPPAEVLPFVTVEAAVRAELAGYWSYAWHRPWLFTSTSFCDLALFSMARARISLRSGQLVTKNDALQDVRASAVLVRQMRQRRGGASVGSSRLLHATSAWLDTVRTVHGR